MLPGVLWALQAPKVAGLERKTWARVPALRELGTSGLNKGQEVQKNNNKTFKHVCGPLEMWRALGTVSVAPKGQSPPCLHGGWPCV